MRRYELYLCDRLVDLDHIMTVTTFQQTLKAKTMDAAEIVPPLQYMPQVRAEMKKMSDIFNRINHGVVFFTARAD